MNKTAQDLRKEYPNVDKIFKTLAELHKDRTDLMICIKEALEGPETRECEQYTERYNFLTNREDRFHLTF